jgi:DNA modification methylase
MTWRILEGDCRAVLAGLPERSVQTCVTSPPYFGLRDYGTGEWDGGDAGCDHRGAPQQSTSSTLAGNGHGPDRLSPALQAQTVPVRACPCGARRVDRQIGLEPTPDEFVAALVGVFREVRRVLRDDGTVWLNLGDSYNADGRKGRAHMGEGKNNGYSAWVNKTMEGTKPKDLLGIPWMVAFALRADGWYLRSDIIWNKPNPMPESVTDRPTKSHEYLFLLSKGPRYFYDADAVREPVSPASNFGGPGPAQPMPSTTGDAINDRRIHARLGNGSVGDPSGRNKRSVWTVATQPFPGAHFATFPPKLIEPCILAGSPPKCCGVCGAPWRRVVEREAAERIEPQHAQMAREEHFRETRPIGQRGNAGMANGAQMAASAMSRTVGWEATCECGDTGRRNTFVQAATVPSVVLDPFAGAGTTGLVALRHDRSFIGIELNPVYAEMARNRIRDDAPLLNTPLEAAA